jgi:hypothetical protein
MYATDKVQREKKRILKNPTRGMNVCVVLKQVPVKCKQSTREYKKKSWGDGGGARFSPPVHTGPGAHPAFCAMGTGSPSRG